MPQVGHVAYQPKLHGNTSTMTQELQRDREPFLPGRNSSGVMLKFRHGSASVAYDHMQYRKASPLTTVARDYNE